MENNNEYFEIGDTHHCGGTPKEQMFVIEDFEYIEPPQGVLK
jgi:hypothetical protein